MAPDNPLRSILSPTRTDGSPADAPVTYTAEPMDALLKRLQSDGAKRRPRGQTGGFGGKARRNRSR